MLALVCKGTDDYLGVFYCVLYLTRPSCGLEKPGRRDSYVDVVQHNQKIAANRTAQHITSLTAATHRSSVPAGLPS